MRGGEGVGVARAGGALQRDHTLNERGHTMHHAREREHTNREKKKKKAKSGEGEDKNGKGVWVWMCGEWIIYCVVCGNIEEVSDFSLSLSLSLSLSHEERAIISARSAVKHSSALLPSFSPSPVVDTPLSVRVCGEREDERERERERE